MANLPKGASDARDLARKIAEDGDRLQAASKYWVERYAAGGETVFDNGEFGSPGLKFAAALPNDTLTSLAPQTAGLVASSEDSVMIKRSGCLMSLAEISDHVEKGSVTAKEIAKRLGALQTGAVQKEDISLPALVSDKEVALAIRYVRELFDVMRRYSICDASAKQHKVGTDEMLAIYRREGGFVITPPRESYRFAPLIDAKPSGCRIDGAPVWDRSTKRGGFVISHEQATSSTPSKGDAVSRSFGLVIRNIVCLAGVDTIIMPRLPVGDELVALLDTALKQSSAPAPLANLKRDVEARLSKAPSKKGSIQGRQASIASQFDIYAGLMLGLLMLRIEETPPGGKLPSADDLFANMEKDFRALMDAHPSTPLEGGRVFIESDNDGSDLVRSMDIEASWYSTRKRVDTLLSRRDRGKLGTLPEWSPFLAYLRFHLGDVVFFGAVIRFLVNFETLVALAKKRKRPWDRPDEFLRLAAKVSWSKKETQQAVKWQNFWKTVGGEQAWRHVGLIETIGSDALRATWLKDAQKAAKGPAGAKMPGKIKKTADTAAEVIAFYRRKELFEIFDVLMRTTPVAIVTDKVPLIGLSTPEKQRKALAKAHSFEQLRIVYAAAIQQSGA